MPECIKRIAVLIMKTGETSIEQTVNVVISIGKWECELKSNLITVCLCQLTIDPFETKGS